MSREWKAFIPGFPAYIVFFGMLGLYAVLCWTVPILLPSSRPLDLEGPGQFGIRIDLIGYPWGFWVEEFAFDPHYRHEELFLVGHFVADLALCLFVSYLAAMALDLVGRVLRARYAKTVSHPDGVWG